MQISRLTLFLQYSFITAALLMLDLAGAGILIIMGDVYNNNTHSTFEAMVKFSPNFTDTMEVMNVVQKNVSGVRNGRHLP